MPQKHTFRASKGNGGFTHAQRPGHKGDSGFSLATRCTEKASNAPVRMLSRRRAPTISHATPPQPNPTPTQNPQNTNDQTSNHETHPRELHATLGVDSAMRQERCGRDTCAVATGPDRAPRRRANQRPGPTGVEGAGGSCRGAGGRWRGLAGLRDDAPSEARSADGQRAGRHPPAHTAAGPDSARNTSGAQKQHKQSHRSSTNTAQGRGPAGPRPLALQLRRERSEVRASGVAELAQLVDRGDPAAALAFGGEQVHAADR